MGRLVAKGELALQEDLLAEALNLCHEIDRKVICLRLLGKPYDEMARELDVSEAVARERYASAIERLTIRLEWVAAREQRGVPPKIRSAMGRARFFGWDAQEISKQLRLPLEAVKRWTRRMDTVTDP